MTIAVGWLYPELMSTYGDRGNIFVFKKRCEWRNINVKVISVNFETSEKHLRQCDIIFGGGAQDRQQKIAVEDLRIRKGPVLQDMFTIGIPGLFVCGSPQLLGHYYMTGDGERLEGLGIFDMVTKHFGNDKPRCIGNLIAEIPDTFRIEGLKFKRTIVGFENHGGRTYLGKNLRPFARVLVGFGNNGEDRTEGAVYNHCIATYSHGPFLSKNPHIADWLIQKALEVKYKQDIRLTPLHDDLEWQAHDAMLARYENA
ncbi:MAG: cobalamin biosynthesis protein CobQ [Patescibacteria group bacterium]|nr:cobalamin biosynthesis protein CobQ [Patescibacteria group bacterium]